MKRGVLEITIGEFAALVDRFDVRKYVGTTISTKIVAAMEITHVQPELPVRLEISEEELEMMMDELAFPSEHDSMDTVSLRKKMTDMMAKFRSAI